MAVAAEQRAPLRLLPHDVEAPRETPARDLEPLRRRIDVMRLQRAGIPGVPADHAPAPRLGELRGDLTRGCAALDELPKNRLAMRTLRLVTCRIGRRQTVLVDPV